jgi:hypothetical protein
LPIRFRHNGFNYRQIVRENDLAIYEQTPVACANPSVSYEVIRIRRRQGFQIEDRFVEPSELYPRSEAWGVDGFTLIDKDAAFARLREIQQASFHVQEGKKGKPQDGKTRAHPKRLPARRPSEEERVPTRASSKVAPDPIPVCSDEGRHLGGFNATMT